MYIPGLYSYEVIIIFIIITITRFFTSVELLVDSNVFKTPISKRMLNLCQIGSKNATTRTFLMWLLAPRGSVKESSGSLVDESAGNFLIFER